MAEDEKIEEDEYNNRNNKKEIIIELQETISSDENISDVKIDKKHVKFKDIPNEKINEVNNTNNNKKKCNFCNTNVKNWSKIVFCPCYCLFYKSFEWVWDGRCEIETYYKSFSFYENIFFCILSIIDLIILLIFKRILSISFLIIRIISDSFGIFVFWLSIILWDEESNNKNYFETGLLFFTFLGLIIMGILDIVSFLIYCTSISEFNFFILMSFLIHLILSIAIFSFNLLRLLH